MCIALLSQALPYDAHIQIGLSILRAIQEHNGTTENETRRFQVRIGINQNTDILILDINGRKNVAGAGINVAARIMDKADAGQILVSQMVFHELQPSETYMDKFKRFMAIGKHDLRLQIHQYVGDEEIGLNREVPSAFGAQKSEEKRLSEEAAHYLAQAIVHRQDLLRINAESRVFWDDAAIVLLRMLAMDSYLLSHIGKFDDRPVSTYAEGTGTLTFDEQYAYYKSQNNWVRNLAKNNIVHNRIFDEGLDLDQYPSCFEQSNYTTHYAFISEGGIQKLRTEWPTVWHYLGLDKYV
jgi:hypothetical protein